MSSKFFSKINNTFIWFGAAVSIAEILTGTYFAPMGLKKGILAILIGHLIGCTLLFFAGYIGALSKKSSMETTGISFGQLGSKFFALLNVLQLVGWTGIMIYDGSLSVNEISGKGSWIWALVIGSLIILWVLIGITNLGILNSIAMTALFILTIVLSKVIFFGKNSIGNSSQTLNSLEKSITFGTAIELAVAMPLSWLPLISDYTKDSDTPFTTTLSSALTYGIVSCWMYIIGMGAAIFTGESDVAVIMVKAGLGIIALIILIISTTTTTFLDAYSSGLSLKTVFPKVSEKWTGICVAAIGTIGAIFLPMDNISGFLYFIGSVFSPMIAILLADYFVLKTDFSNKKIDMSRMLIWLVGFILYRVLMRFDIIIGNTIPDMIFAFVVTVLAGKIQAKKA